MNGLNVLGFLPKAIAGFALVSLLSACAALRMYLAIHFLLVSNAV